MHISIEVTENPLITLQVIGLICRCFEMLWLHFAKKTYRIMSNFFPQAGIECAIQCACFGMPTPPQIISKFIQSINTRGHDGENRHAAINFHVVDYPFFYRFASVYLL